ncbi:MAG: efflux RND transporter periplasmic adaptor subunit [Alphaproteobacteria bacterium]|nr:efflux RND transporter periplasmic adaptor subunit [Alphaproteobacteria bacterium]
MSANEYASWPRLWVVVAAGLAIVGVSIAAGFWLGSRPAEMKALSGTAQNERSVLYWYDPMVPDQRFDKPGKSPFMDMDLVPRYADLGAASSSGASDPTSGVRIDAGTSQNLGIRLAVVERGAVSSSLKVFGVIGFNERDLAIVQAKQSGFVDRGYRRALGDVVQAGDPLVDLRVPEWTGALGEYLALRAANDDLAKAAGQRVAMLGVPPASVREAEKRGSAPSVFTIHAPISGAITAFDIREGMSIEAGAPLATINGLSPVWLTASVPQAIAGRLRVGGRVAATASAYPGTVLEGRIETVLPVTGASSRAVELRVSLPNPGARLRPGMTAEVDLAEAGKNDAIMAPSEALIRTGRRTVVIVVLPDGRFAPVEVTTGVSFGDRTEILEGLEEGQQVVASGQFLIDSEASLSGVIARLRSGGSAPEPGQHRSSGRVTAVDATGVTIAHAPIASLDWPSMTMRFAWGEAGASRDVAAGDEVVFEFRQSGSDYIVQSISPSEADR